MIPRPTLLGNGIAVASAGIAVPLGGLPPMRPINLLPVITEEQAMQVAGLAQQTQPTAAAQANATAEPADIPFEIVAAEDIPTRPGQSALDQATYVATGVMPEQPSYPANDPIGAWIAETMKLAEPEVGTLQPGQVLVPPAPIERPVDLISTNSSDAVPGGGWIVQVGAANSQDAADQMLSQASQSYGQLADLRGYVESFQRDGLTFYRARFAGFADRSQARSTCDALTQASINCLTVQG
jgi:D-alanyl-D-alanine carboxypeptidase